MNSQRQTATERAKASRHLSSFRQILAACIATRLIIDTATQLFNFYLQTIARGLALDIVVLGRFVSLRNVVGLAAPLFGSAADRYGYRRIMRLSLLLSAAGMFLFGSGGGLWSVAAGMIMLGLGLIGFVPTSQAYISSQLPFAHRARGIGVLEYSWALAGIVGLSLMGLLFDLFSWQIPFFVLGAATLAGWALLGLLPGAPNPDNQDPDLSATAAAIPLQRRIASFFDLGPNRRSAYAVIYANGLFFFSQLHILIAHGAWLQTEYGLNPSALGLVALSQGVADLCGSVLVSLITDRIGKKRAVQAGMLGSALIYSSLPIINVGLALVTVVLALMRFAVQYGIVSAIALISEQAPDRRGKVISLAMALSLLGGTLSGFSGPWMYTNFGVWGLGPLSAGCALLAFILLTFWGRESA